MNPASAPKREDDDWIRYIATLDAKLQVYSPKYTFLLSYFFTNCVLFFFPAVDEYLNWPEHGFLSIVICVGRGFGRVLNLNVALLFILASRKTLGFLRNTVVGTILPIDEAMPELHSFIAYACFAAATIHGVCHCIASTGMNLWAPGFGKNTWCIVSGYVIFSLYGLIVATSMAYMRRRRFEVFLHVHMFGSLLFIPIICLHGFYNAKPYSYKWVLGPAMLYLFDKLARKMSENQASVRIHVDSNQRKVTCSGGIVRISFPRPFYYRAGQYAELCIPIISKTQWHPFTMASAPSEDEFVFFVKHAGDWTTSLHRICKEGLNPKTTNTLSSFDIKVRGPYGASAQHVGQYDKILLISDGVGATPFCSITKSATDIISRQCHQEQQALTDSSSSLNTDCNAHENEGDITDEPSSESWNHPHILDLGLTFDYGMHRPRRPMTGARHEIFKHPTISRNRQIIHDASPVPTQTWMQFFHSLSSTTLYNTAVIWVMLIRFTVCLLGAAFLDVDWEARGTDIFDSTALKCIDLVLGTFSLVLLLFSVVSELASERRLFIEDVMLLIPLSALPVVLHTLAFLGKGKDIGYFAQNYFYIGWPLLLVLTIFRYFRVLGRRALLADTVKRNHQTTRSIDFIWTTKTTQDDEWLMDELSKSVGRSKYVRLHRYIAEEARKDVEHGERSHDHHTNMFQERATLCTETLGTPDWHEIFAQFTSSMRNGTTTGIFFCGPPKIAAAVKEAAMESMLDSRYRGLSNRAQVKQTPGLHSQFFSHDKVNSVTDSLTRSFNVRYVFRAETF